MHAGKLTEFNKEMVYSNLLQRSYVDQADILSLEITTGLS